MSILEFDGWTTIATMQRLGKSVEELARETVEDILGYIPPRNEGDGDKSGHKPARPDIQKMQDAYDLYSQAFPDGVSDTALDEAKVAQKEWKEKYGLTESEKNFIGYWQQEFRSKAGGDAEHAFRQLAMLMDSIHGRTNDDKAVVRDDGVWHGPEGDSPTTEGKREAGALIKRYEENHYKQLYPAIVRFLKNVSLREPSSYKLWPWAIKQMKSQYQDALGWGSLPEVGNHSARELGVDHMVDIVGEGGALLSRLRAENRIPQNFDLNHLDFKQFEDWMMQWKRDNREAEAQGQVVYQFHDGWTIQKLTTPEQLQFEGDTQGHCVGSYASEVGSGRTIIYSLRDPKGMPHVTMEMHALEGAPSYGFAEGEEPPEGAIYNHEYIHPDAHTPGEHMEPGVSSREPAYRPTGETPFEVVQVQGNSNKTPKPEYQRKIKEFLDALRAKGWKFVRSEDWFAPFDDPSQSEYGEGAPDTAQKLDEWYDDHYKTHHEAYRGIGDGDAYGLPSERATLGISDWEELFKDCFRSLVYEYDPGKWTGRWQDLAQAVYHAWMIDIYKDRLDPDALEKHRQNLVDEIQSAEQTLHEWNDENWFYVEEHRGDEIAEKIKDEAQKRGELDNIEKALDEQYGEDGWDDRELRDWVQDNDEDLWYAANDSIRDEATDEYAGDAYKFVQYLIYLAEKHGALNPQDLPNPNERNGGLPSFEDLEQMPWRGGVAPTNIGETPVEEGLPGTLSAWRAATNEIQIHPIDNEHNVWFDEDGNQRARYRPGWAKNPETGKMEQTGELQDTFLDKHGRQGQGVVAYDGDQPVGSLTWVDDQGWHMLGTAYVHPNYREQGIFNQMVAPLRETGRPIDAYVWNNPWLKQKVRSWR